MEEQIDFTCDFHGFKVLLRLPPTSPGKHPMPQWRSASNTGFPMALEGITVRSNMGSGSPRDEYIFR